MGAGLDIDGLLQTAVGRCLGSLIGNTDALPALAVAEYGQVDKQPKIEGRNMVMYLVPKKN